MSLAAGVAENRQLSGRHDWTQPNAEATVLRSGDSTERLLLDGRNSIGRTDQRHVYVAAWAHVAPRGAAIEIRLGYRELLCLQLAAQERHQLVTQAGLAVEQPSELLHERVLPVQLEEVVASRAPSAHRAEVGEGSQRGGSGRLRQSGAAGHVTTTEPDAGQQAVEHAQHPDVAPTAQTAVPRQAATPARPSYPP